MNKRKHKYVMNKLNPLNYLLLLLVPILQIFVAILSDETYIEGLENFYKSWTDSFKGKIMRPAKWAIDLKLVKKINK